MRCFIFLCSSLLRPPSKCCLSICVPSQYNTHTTRIQTNYICPPPITPQTSFFSPLPSPSPCLTILGFSLHFNSALNCQDWIALWTAWGGQAGRRCVWMREPLCYHHLFSFSSPSGAVRSQTRYHSLPAPQQGVTTQRWGNDIKE